MSANNETGKVPSAEETANRLAILEVIYMHCRGVDRASAAILKSCYWPEAELDYGFYQGPAHPFCDSLVEGLKRHSNTQHQVSNTLIELKGKEAFSETYLTAHHYLPEPDAENSEMTYFGRYLDRMLNKDGVWKIVYRKIVMTWHQQVATSEDFEKNPALAGIARASRYPEDPWFGFVPGP